MIFRTYGPGSGEAKFALQKVDQMIAHLVEELQMNKLYEDMNIVVTGVHGFVEVTADKVVEEISGDLADKTLITGEYEHLGSLTLSFYHYWRKILSIDTNTNIKLLENTETF